MNNTKNGVKMIKVHLQNEETKTKILKKAKEKV